MFGKSEVVKSEKGTRVVSRVEELRVWIEIGREMKIVPVRMRKVGIDREFKLGESANEEKRM